MMTNPEDLPISGKFAKWFMAKATIFDDVDIEYSKGISRSCKIKECYKNSALASIRQDLTYHEGFVSPLRLNGIRWWTNHAFLVKEGRVVDPTMAIGDRIDSEFRYIGIPIPDALQRMVKKELFTDLIPDLYSEDHIRDISRDTLIESELDIGPATKKEVAN